jgi:S1-C subfamily serine protease
MMFFSDQNPKALIGCFLFIVMIQANMAVALSPPEVGQIAKKITVRIDARINNDNSYGSGVIIKREGNIYTIITAYHVVKEPGNYEIIAPDKNSYDINYQTVTKIPDADLAVMQFTSNQTYAVAKIVNSDLYPPGTAVHVAGFPKPTASFRQRELKFISDMKIETNSSQNPSEGYGLRFSLNNNNKPIQGMSGGPIINDKGELIGIHGQSNKVNENLGIPINIFMASEVAKSLGWKRAPLELPPSRPPVIRLDPSRLPVCPGRSC